MDIRLNSAGRHGLHPHRATNSSTGLFGLATTGDPSGSSPLNLDVPFPSFSESPLSSSGTELFQPDFSAGSHVRQQEQYRSPSGPTGSFGHDHMALPAAQSRMTAGHGLSAVSLNPAVSVSMQIQYIASADHTLLLQAQNSAYMLRLQQIEALTQSCDHYKMLTDKLITQIPQLIPLNLEVPEISKLARSNVMGTASWAHTRPVLGLGMAYPDVPPTPPAVHYKVQDDWTKSSEPKITGKRGAHDSSQNIAQRYVEDENGEPVAGHIAEEARKLVTSLLHSLVWSGQYAAKSKALPYEAKVYMHVVLAQNFPELLYCTAGRWKVDLLITQQHSGFHTNHGSKAAEVAIKLESSAAVGEGSRTSAINPKRERSPALEVSELQPANKRVRPVTPPIVPLDTSIVRAAAAPATIPAAVMAAQPPVLFTPAVAEQQSAAAAAADQESLDKSGLTTTTRHHAATAPGPQQVDAPEPRAAESPHRATTSTSRAIEPPPPLTSPISVDPVPVVVVHCNQASAVDCGNEPVLDSSAQNTVGTASTAGSTHSPGPADDSHALADSALRTSTQTSESNIAPQLTVNLESATGINPLAVETAPSASVDALHVSALVDSDANATTAPAPQESSKDTDSLIPVPSPFAPTVRTPRQPRDPASAGGQHTQSAGPSQGTGPMTGMSPKKSKAKASNSGAANKASFRPGVISLKNFHTKFLVEKNPGVTSEQCKNDLADLQGNLARKGELEEIQASLSAARAAKKMDTANTAGTVQDVPNLS